ncbi:hypothetical protein GCK32_013812 [Trichostrongylus colubriformis]|uniref:Uncharacterized protein n=1 Tax=Trichostrongylus colubriformis TaxID=6319 RepID=A0AAN8FPS7_TRICO
MEVLSCVPLCQCCSRDVCREAGVWCVCTDVCMTSRLSVSPEKQVGWLSCAIEFTVCMLSLGVCIIWFIYRRSPYAFILLNFINVTICLIVAVVVRLPNVQSIAVCMIIMFVHDVVMVFVTPFFTREGCSVMEEFVTGIACSSRNTERYPIAPIDAPLPEPFPFIMQVPIVVPMEPCVDLDIEKGFKMAFLTLSDILVPGMLVAHCFVMDSFSEPNRIFYGVLCSIGYGFGLILMSVASVLMDMGQPALLYLDTSAYYGIDLKTSLLQQLVQIRHESQHKATA